MPKRSGAIDCLPPQAVEALRKLGEDLAVARVRRQETQRIWAKRLGVSIPTLIRVEQGDPSVSMGVYATALWMIGRVQPVSELADPRLDAGALEFDVGNARKKRAVRSKASIEVRLGQVTDRTE
jgi:hypothetical protein